ncbi:MAG: alpha/beta-hydrolase family protein [Pseudomonadota bacterium]
MAPLRVYVGLNAGDTPQERADLALRELIRVGGFERAILAVATPTGTGFMEEFSTRPLEYLHRGDVATVAQQYSYMQSPFSLIFEPGYGAESARALFRAVYDHWTAMPKDSRPKLFLQGLSLGSLSSEAALRLHEVLGDPPNGALWSGPPFPSQMHREVTAERDPGSPQWLPIFEDGAFIRFTNQDNALGIYERPWGRMRIVYLQYASDPIVFFDTATLWRRPDWLAAPRGPDVSPLVRWYPIVTAFQLLADMPLATTAPRGYGHEYAAGDYIDSWVSITDPDVTEAQIERLKTFFADWRGP